MKIHWRKRRNKMATLYELTEEMKNFDFEIDEETGEITNAGDLDDLKMERNEKIKNCVFYYKNILAEADALKAEKMKLQQRQQIAERKAERMKQYLEYCLDGKEFKPDDDVRVRITYRKSKSVECDDIARVPEEYLRFRTPELDKTKVKKAIASGETVKGCVLVEKSNIQIK